MSTRATVYLLELAAPGQPEHGLHVFRDGNDGQLHVTFERGSYDYRSHAILTPAQARELAESLLKEFPK